jgi:NAD(P)H-nitrite reductase large subunit
MVGAGFIGFIMLNAMLKRGWQLAVVERESHVLPRMLNADAARMVENWLGAHGVKLYCGTTVRQIRTAGKGSKCVDMANGASVEADVVIVATGIRPNVELLAGSGIEVDEGILVNNRMQTNIAHVYAGGDVAQGPILFSDRRAIHAIQPTAVDHGRVAGANMAGDVVRYQGSLLMNILDVGGLQCASFGNWSDANAEATTICNDKGFIYRRLLWTGDQITGALFVGRANDLGMLTDVGMVKGIMQTQTRLGAWKAHLAENPYDIRRPFVAAKVADKLARTTLLGRPSVARRYRYGALPAATHLSKSHGEYVGTRGESVGSDGP